MNSFHPKSQFEILNEELAKIRSTFPDDQLRSLLHQISLLFSETDFSRNSKELKHANPIETLRGHLIGISDPESIAEWHAALSLYLFGQIQELEQQSKSEIVELALQSLNFSKKYSEEAERQKRIEKRKRSAAGIRANEKKNEPLEILKEAAYKEYEPAIRLIQKRNETAGAPTVITYLSIAKVVYPKIEHLNCNERGRKLIGRNTQKKTKTKATPITALAALFKRAVAKNILKSPVKYR